MRGAQRTTWVWLGLAVLFVVPWVMRGVILSGYLVFPVSRIDLFAFDWKVSAEQAEAARNGIVGFARLPGRDWQSALSMPFSQWVPVWIGNLTFNQRSIFILALILPLITLVSGAVARISYSGRYWVGMCILYSGVLFWFLSAPDIRFGYGFLGGVCVYACAPLLDFVIRKFDSRKRVAVGLIVPVLILFQGYNLLHSMDLSTLRGRILLPLDYSKSRAEACDIKNATVFCRVTGGQCNYDAFPCIPSPRPDVEMRGSTFRDGFRLDVPALDSNSPSVP
jgi:hypothetical protein